MLTLGKLFYLQQNLIYSFILFIFIDEPIHYKIEKIKEFERIYKFSNRVFIVIIDHYK